MQIQRKFNQNLSLQEFKHRLGSQKVQTQCSNKVHFKTVQIPSSKEGSKKAWAPKKVKTEVFFIHFKNQNPSLETFQDNLEEIQSWRLKKHFQKNPNPSLKRLKKFEIKNENRSLKKHFKQCSKTSSNNLKEIRDKNKFEIEVCLNYPHKFEHERTKNRAQEQSRRKLETKVASTKIDMHVEHIWKKSSVWQANTAKHTWKTKTKHKFQNKSQIGFHMRNTKSVELLSETARQKNTNSNILEFIKKGRFQKRTEKFEQQRRTMLWLQRASSHVPMFGHFESFEWCAGMTTVFAQCPCCLFCLWLWLRNVPMFTLLRLCRTKAFTTKT